MSPCLQPLPLLIIMLPDTSLPYVNSHVCFLMGHVCVTFLYLFPQEPLPKLCELRQDGGSWSPPEGSARLVPGKPMSLPPHIGGAEQVCGFKSWFCALDVVSVGHACLCT